MRISWGYKIFMAYTTFALGILFLAYKASHQNFDLVTENYYEAELKYQDVIDQKSHVAQLSEAPKIQHTVNTVSVQLPKEFANKTVEGEIYLYRPSDASKDIRKKFSTAQAFYELNLDKDLSGSYEVKLSWQSEGKRFFQEQKIFF
ncbi:FixH family protein [Flavisolibacter ginsenosidimutans]|uniref:Nitrogen fixation protein FixH n=1 Tax=Flavisolibacter ginsenosidimutans TaxID=661481 RepID=A0A5B8UDP2_9BACT|nr:FixH family protein [Flavisolibacter ginsenosidimutans]QEC54801.1 hypothetical protein FSB75_02420 [Flavisolibacter ginsenosidimutans]